MSPRPDVLDHPARVLIVDDERQNRQLLEAMLGPEGLTLLTAASGEEALAIVAQQPPDLVLLDVMMPGMDGYEVARRIKSTLATRSIPVVMVTALDDRSARMRGLEAGAEDFLSKPVDRAELCVRVRNLLRLKAYGDYHDRYSQKLEVEVASRTADLVESERLYRETFDSAPVGILHVGLDGRWLRANQRLCDLLGYSREELQSPAVKELVQAEDVAGEAEAFLSMTSGALERHVLAEKRYRRRDGTLVLARVNMSVHRDAAGRVQHVISLVEDVTAQRALEAQVRQASKMDAIGRMASGVAHDFNNLLTVILGFAEIVSADKDLSERHVEDLGEIIKAAQRAAGLTKQLLAFSRQQSLRAAPLDVNELITEMNGMLGRLIGEQVEVALSLAPDLPPALVDRGQLEQVVMNLVVNARDAMPSGGIVTISTSEVEVDGSGLQDGMIAPGPYVMLAITDTGTGMSEETQRHLFEPFYTTKESGKGTGLGLSTTYGIVKQSSGYILVTSEPAHGTTFRVYLPRSGGAIPASEAVAPPVPAAAAAPETILLVEDESGVRRFATRVLAEAGYRVLEAANGDDAETIFVARTLPIDLVLTDVVMPGCGGLELLDRLRVLSPDVRALYMSGHIEHSAAQKAALTAGLPFLQKPFTPAELVSHVRAALDR